MLKAYKTEVLLNPKQALKIRKTLGTCRYLYNLYLERILRYGFYFRQILQLRRQKRIDVDRRMRSKGA